MNDDRPDNTDDINPVWYLERIEFPGKLLNSLEEHGFTNVQVDAEPGAPDCYTVNMRWQNGPLDAVGVKQQLKEIVRQLPATHKYHITWSVLQSVAIVQGDQVAASLLVREHFPPPAPPVAQPPPPVPPPPQFDPGNPDAWLAYITENAPTFIRSLCKSLYHENFFVRLAQRPALCRWGMTSRGRTGPLIDEEDPEGSLARMPPLARMLPTADTEYDALVRQGDPDARQPIAFAVAAFKRAGGNVPLSPGNTDKWEVRHAYRDLISYDVGNVAQADQAAKHFTQSANLVALHPVVLHLMAEHPCIQGTLQARVFTAFGNDNRYDPAQQFAPARGHDTAGFVLNGQ